MHISPRVVGYCCALTSAIIWAGNFLTARVIAPDLTPFVTTLLRWIVASVILLPFAWKQCTLDWPLIRKHLPYYVSLTTTGVFLMQITIYFGGHNTTAMNMGLIASTGPIWFALLARFILKEHITTFQIIGICIAMLGTVLLITRGDLSLLFHMSFNIGDLSMLASSWVFAYYSITLRKKIDGVSSISALFTTFVMGIIMAAPFAMWDFYHGATVPCTIEIALSVLYIGCFASIVAFFCWARAIERIGPVQSSLVNCGLPLFSALGGYFILGEHIEMAQLLSGLLIIGGTIVAMLKSPSKKAA
ncbi:MAG: DMT family transporter [Pseudomonadota bacterium]